VKPSNSFIRFFMSPTEKRELINIYNLSRAFCGNPRQAVRDWEKENRLLKDGEYPDLLEAANLAWEEAGKTWVIGEAAARKAAWR